MKEVLGLSVAQSKKKHDVTFINQEKIFFLHA